MKWKKIWTFPISSGIEVSLFFATESFSRETKLPISGGNTSNSFPDFQVEYRLKLQIKNLMFFFWEKWINSINKPWRFNSDKEDKWKRHSGSEENLFELKSNQSKEPKNTNSSGSVDKLFPDKFNQTRVFTAPIS